jgi:hypothetical protein
MSYEDPNKGRREQERRVLQKDGWVAVAALKDNGAFQWKWIHKTRKRAYSRSAAFALAYRSLQRQGVTV